MSEDSAQNGGRLGSAETDPVVNPVVLWRLLRKYWSTALAVAMVVSLVVVFQTLGQVKIYQAQATIQFDPNPPRPLGRGVETVVEMGAGDYWDTREYYETQYKIIQSMRVSQAVVEELGLQHDAAFLANLPPGAPTPPPADASLEAAAGALRGRTSVEPIKGSRLALVRMEDADPQRAQRLLGALIDTYISLNLEDALSSTNNSADWLRGQVDKLKIDLEANEMALHQYKEHKNILSVAFDDQSNMLREEMKQLNEALTTVRTRGEEIAARRDQLAKVRTDNPTNLPASELLQSSLLQELRRKYGDAVQERDGLLGAGKGEAHPEVLAATARIEASKSALLAEVRNIQGALNADYAIVRRQETGLAGLFERAKKQALDLNLLEIEYNRLRRSKENTEKLYSLVLERSKESDLTRMLRVNNIRVLDRPLLPGAPVRPRVFVNIGLGLFAGLLLGIGAAVARGLIDRSIKTPDDLEHELGITFLGLLPEIDQNSTKRTYYASRRKQRSRASPLGTPELIVHDHPTSGIAEASRAIRTNLMFMAPDKPYRTLLVTSAGPSEGKTTVATCIAIAMAQAGQRVALIDCDLRRPRVHRVFKHSSAVGVTTALLDDNLDHAVLTTPVPNLSIIPAGPIPPNPAELLHSERFKVFLAEVAERFDRVIIDSPPLVAVTDAAILSTVVDSTILVVRAFSTSKELARHALRSLKDVGCRAAGAVLNAVNLSRHEYKYSHYQYKRDGYYAEDPAERPSAANEESSAAPPH